MTYLILAIIFGTIALACVFLVAALMTKHTRLVKKQRQVSDYLKKLSITLNSARWGNLKVEAQEGFNETTKNISKSLNALLESVLDRDDMILEYVEKEKENNEITRDFVAMLTHDLKVPIIAQDNTLDLLLDGKFGQLNEVQTHAIKNIKISNLDLKHLVESLLESHNYRKKGFKVEKIEFELKKFCEDIVLQTQNVANLHEKEIRLFDEGVGDLKVKTDKVLLKRIMMNFLLNAVSYGINSKFIDITLSCDKKTFSLGVKDYGLGISKEDLDKIFNKYYSAAQVYSKVSTGLGLYLSNKIATALGGKIKVESRENEGANFIITIPLK